MPRIPSHTGPAPSAAGRRPVGVRVTPTPPEPERTGRRPGVLISSKQDGFDAGPNKRLPTSVALASTRAFLMGEEQWSPKDDGSIIIQDPADVNSGGDTAKSARAGDARKLLARNEALETQCLSTMPRKERDQYLTLKKDLLAGEGADPVAAVALQSLLFAGKLNEGALLGQLSKVRTQELAYGVDRQPFLADLVQSVATPVAMNQGGEQTCVATSVEVQLAMRDPAEFVRLSAGLATPRGTVELRNGATLSREPGVLPKPPGADKLWTLGRKAKPLAGEGLALPQRLLAPALMEYGNGKAEYSARADTSTRKGKTSTGLTPGGAERIVEALYDQPASSTIVSKRSRADTLERILTEAKTEGSALAGLVWPPTKHMVLVTGSRTREGTEYVEFVNPWGHRALMPKDKFLEKLFSANF